MKCDVMYKKLTLEDAKSLFDLDQKTGALYWKEDVGGRARLGGKAGCVDNEGYTVVRYQGVGYRAHRIVFALVHGRWPEGVVDHVNGVKGDNRPENLRDTTPHGNANNSTNRACVGASGVRNVTWFSQYQKWKAAFCHAGRLYFVGHFDSVDAAARAVSVARKSLGCELVGGPR